MSETLGQTSDVTWPAAKEAARAAVRRAGQTLLALAIERAVSRAESVLDYVDAHATDSPGQAGDSPAREADSPAREADSPGHEGHPLARAAGAAAAATAQVAGDGAEDDPEHGGNGTVRGGVMGVLSDLLHAGLQLVVDIVDRLAGRLEDIVAGGGVVPAAGLGAGVAALVGKNPIWGAIKGGFSALSPGAKVLIIIALILAAILLPVTVLLLLIVAAVIILVLAMRDRTRKS